MEEQGRKGCEFGAASVLDPLAKLPGWRNPLAFLVWVGMEDGGGGGGEKNKDVELFSFLPEIQLVCACATCVQGGFHFLPLSFFWFWAWCVAALLSVCFGCWGKY